MDEEKRKAYSEVIEILKLIDIEEKIEKIPFEVIQLIKSNSDPTYKPEIRKDIPLEDQNLKDETYSIMAWIANKFWGENIGAEEGIIKDYSDEKLAQSDETHESNIIIEEPQKQIVTNAAVYNDIEPDVLNKVNLPALVPELNWYQRIKEKVIKFLKMIFKPNKRGEGVSE